MGAAVNDLPPLPKHGLVLTDPPYGIGAARGSHSNLKMADEAWDDDPPMWLTEQQLCERG